MGIREAIMGNESAARGLDGHALAQALAATRARTLDLWQAYEWALGPSLQVPCAPELNPPLWEWGHVGWFADWWIARNPHCALGIAADPAVPRLPARQARRGLQADALFDSSVVAHRQRWHLPLPSPQALQDDLAEGLRDTLALLAQAPQTDAGLYFFRLALFHEAMHAEAAVYMAQTLGFDPGAQATLGLQATVPDGLPAQLSVASGARTLGYDGQGFAFDNELPAHTVCLSAFTIDATPVTWVQFLPFLDTGAYHQDQFWTPEGQAWRKAQAAPGPRHLRNGTQGWERLVFGQWCPLHPQAPACHLTVFEAAAWCCWAGRRLPTEAEWEAAAVHPHFAWGQVWEWTASPFAPFAGFKPHPYLDYSQPWFGNRPVLKGASFATAPHMRHRKYRNYFLPDRNDIFAGFRSVAL